jgi:hypothetical protein
MPRIPFWRTIGAAFGFVFGNPARLVRIIWIWPALSAAYFALDLMIPISHSPAMVLLASVITIVVGIAVLIAVSVALFRAVLLGDTSWTATLHFGRRHWRLLGTGTLIVLAMAIPTLLLQNLLLNLAAGLIMSGQGSLTLLTAGNAVVTLLMLALWSVCCRLMLALPAAALDERDDLLATAWERSRGNTWRLFLASLACWLPFYLLGSVIDRIASSYGITGHSTTLASGLTVTIETRDIAADVLFVGNLLLPMLLASVMIVFYAFAFRRLAGGDGAVSIGAEH